TFNITHLVLNFERKLQTRLNKDCSPANIIITI
ncbi:unnamed protein product, partial [Heterotrigona itama]